MRTEIDGLDLGMSLATLLDALKQCQDATLISPIGDDDDDASVDSLSYYRRSGRLVQKNE
jgi:hypothetical protein